MFWIICSSQSTRRATKRCASDSLYAKPVVAAGKSGTFKKLFAAALVSTLALGPSLPVHAAKRVALVSSPAISFAPTGVFQSLEFETNATAGMASWNSVQDRMASERAAYAACDKGLPDCNSNLRAWREKLSAWQSLSVNAKLIQVNSWANGAVHYVDDRIAYRRPDYWASPAQSLQGRGDCEDYVLLKYESLRALGIAESAMRIVIVKDLRRDLGHAVLSVKTDDGTFILDNQDTRVLRHDSITRYAPIYSVNATGRWINIATRDLRKRKPAEVALMASTQELETIAPAAAPQGKALKVNLPNRQNASLKLRPSLFDTLMPDVSHAQPSGATAMIARMRFPIETPTAMLLRPSIEG